MNLDKHIHKVIWSLLILSIFIEIILDFANYQEWSFRRKYPSLVLIQSGLAIASFILYLKKTTELRRILIFFIGLPVLGIIAEFTLLESNWYTYNVTGYKINGLPVLIPFFYFMGVYMIHLLVSNFVFLIKGILPHKSNGNWKWIVAMLMAEVFIFLQLTYLTELESNIQDYVIWNKNEFTHFVGHTPFRIFIIYIFLSLFTALPIHLYDYFIQAPNNNFNRSLLFFPLAILAMSLISPMFVGFKEGEYLIVMGGINIIMLLSSLYGFILLKK